MNVEDFETAGQYRKYLKVRAFFESLISLHAAGCAVFVEGRHDSGVPFIDGVNMGFEDENCRVLWVGGCYCDNGKPWIDISVTELKRRIEAFRLTSVAI